MKLRDVTFLVRLTAISGVVCLCLSCSDDPSTTLNNTTTNNTKPNNTTPTNNPKPTNNRNSPTNNVIEPPPPSSCNCTSEQVCDVTTNACIAKPTPSSGDIMGEIFLLNQLMEGSTSMSGHLGKATAMFWDEQAYPVDDRESFAATTGRCHFVRGAGENYPTFYKGVMWPSGDRRSAGDLSITVVGAPGNIILNQENFGMGGGVSYSHNDVPPPLQDGLSTHQEMFDPQYVPLGGTFSVEAVGDTDIPATNFTGGLMPHPYLISSPPDYNKTQAKIDVRNGLAVTWSPAQPDAMMRIFINTTKGSEMMQAKLECIVKDDGSTQIPQEALTAFSAETTIQLQRDVVRYKKHSAEGGKDLHLYLIGRHARIRTFYIE